MIVACRTNTPVLVGVDFRTADHTQRSRLSLTGALRDRALTALRNEGASEAFVLSTCNRTELLAFGIDPRALRRVLTDLTGVSATDLEPHLFGASAEEAVRHVFRVCSGLESAAVGESEIVTQLKEAWQAAREHGLVGKQLDLLLQNALRTSKRVRTETDLCRGVVSYATLAVREASAMAGGLGDKRIVIVGAGELAERLLKELRRTPPARVTLANRTLSRAEALAKKYGHGFAPLEDLPALLPEADILITAINGAIELVDKIAFEAPIYWEPRAAAKAIEPGTPPLPPKTDAVRAVRPLTVVDLGVPANLPIAFTDQPHIKCIGMDELVRRSHRNSERRAGAVPLACAIIDEEMARYHTERSRREAYR